MRQHSGLENKKILIVEDVELNQYLARYIMESWGCIVDIAENGAVALEKIDKNDFDLVLMDIQMPVMDGMEATKRIRSMKDNIKSTVPVVALTANAQKGDYEIYIMAGMNDCLPKPFEEPDLFQTVSKNIRSDKKNFVDANGQLEAKQEDVADTSTKLYNLAMVEAISGGDRSFVTKMLQLFLDTVPATLTDIRMAANSGEWLTLSKLAHKLKSTVDSMGIAELKQDIRSIESVGKSGNDTSLLPGTVDRVIVVMEQVMAQVKKDHSL